MIIDSSAVVAILKQEEDAHLYSDAIQKADSRTMSLATYLEVAMVLERTKDPLPARKLDSFVADAEINLAGITLEEMRIARAAWRDFGKGSGHKAQLNFGDLFTYALATDRREPLLFKGDDFSHTDIESALKNPR